MRIQTNRIKAKKSRNGEKIGHKRCQIELLNGEYRTRKRDQNFYSGRESKVGKSRT